MIEFQTMNADGSNCINFIERKSEKNYVRIINENGCWSYVGKFVDQRPQSISLQAPDCIEIDTVAHELMHALGLHHEHNRPDRDEWVEINFENIIKERRTSKEKVFVVFFNFQC